LVRARLETFPKLPTADSEIEGGGAIRTSQESILTIKTICVLGLGYIGLPMVSTLASRGVKVLGVDINAATVDTLRKGEIHIQEPGLLETYRSALASGNLALATRPAEAEAFIIAVPTPFQDGESGEYQGQHYKLADMRAVASAARSIVPFLRKGNLVVLESTSPPRTTVDLVAPILAESGLQAGADFHLAYSPERVLPGQILRELTDNARVVGGVTPASAEAAAGLYAIFVRSDIVQTDATTAELVKLMENTYRDVNIAVANEFSRLADRFGVDVWEAISLANRHPRVKILNPGPGVGGHCISVDPWFLVEAAPDLATLVAAARHVNDSQPAFVAHLIKESAGALAGKKIAALGLAYKADVDDLRESPAAEVVRLLQAEGAIVKAWEPFKPDAVLPGVTMASTMDAALKEAEMIVLLVGHTEFVRMSAQAVAARTPARVIVDTVGGWRADEWHRAGFRVVRLGGVNR
jgi:UDP-N-acetyl-D-mannosaminuronic acid dehydrogenase